MSDNTYSKRDKMRALMRVGVEGTADKKARSDSLDRQRALTVDLTLVTDIFPYLIGCIFLID